MHGVLHVVLHVVEIIYPYNIMKIPTYDNDDDIVTNFKQLYDFMPNQCFRMLLAGPTSSGKTNTLLHTYDLQIIVL